MIPALISAGAALLGGALNRRAQQKANIANAPVSQVKQWEAAGINPAFGISQGQYIPQQVASIGDSFAQAGGLFADGVRRKEELALEETELRQENRELRENLDELSRSRGPSYMQQYGHILPLPSQGENNAVSRVRSSTDGSGTSTEPSEPVIGVPSMEGTDQGRSTVTALGNLDSEYYMDPTRMDAETAEARVGDIGQEIIGVRNLFDDARYNHALNRASPYFDASRAEIHQRVVDDPSFRADVMAAPNPFSIPEVTGSYLDPVIVRARRGQDTSWRYRPDDRPLYQRQYGYSD